MIDQKAGGGSGLAAEPHALQEEEEQAGDVQVQVERSKHILLGRDSVLPVFPPQDKMSVENQVLQRHRRGAVTTQMSEETEATAGTGSSLF